MEEDKNGTPEAEPKKPSIISQLIPYVFAIAILAYVFTGLSSSVVDEKHTITGDEWTALEFDGGRKKTVEVYSEDRVIKYCASGREYDTVAGCPDGGDYELKQDEEGKAPAIKRTGNSRIDSGDTVSVDYAKDVRFSEIMAMIGDADLRFFLPLIILHCLIFFFGDVYSFGQAYRFFNTPDIKTRELMECRGAPYVIQIGLAVLAEVFFPLYMYRVKKAPVTDIVSSNIWTMILDLSAVFTIITPAVLYNLYGENLVPAIGPGWLIAVCVFWAVFFANIIFWHSPLQGKARSWIASGREDTESKTRVQKIVGELMQLLRTFSMARWHHYLKVWFVRMIIWISAIVSNYAALLAVGVDPPTALTLIAIPIIVLAIFQPIGVGGYGGPQLIAWFLLVKLGNAGTADQVLAYSFLWSTGFLIGRAAIGLFFIRGFWKRTFPSGFSLR